MTVWQIRQTTGTRKAPLSAKDGYCPVCWEQRNLGCSRPHRTVQECPSCQLIPGMWHLWNCLCQDFLLWHLWFLRLPHHRKRQIRCSSPQGFLYPATLMSSLDTETRWKGLNVSLARWVDGISLISFDSDTYKSTDPITSSANRLQSNTLLLWNILCDENRKDR